jgi:hypothetical protein
MKSVSILNAPWWLNHSIVICKGRLLAGDVAEINNSMVTMEVVNGVPVVITKGGNQAILKVQRMITQGTVAVLDDEGDPYEVSLPKDAHLLYQEDLEYICAQIDAKGKPMSAEAQKAFLASAKNHLEAHSHPANLSLMNS